MVTARSSETNFTKIPPVSQQSSTIQLKSKLLRVRPNEGTLTGTMPWLVRGPRATAGLVDNKTWVVRWDSHDLSPRWAKIRICHSVLKTSKTCLTLSGCDEVRPIPRTSARLSYWMTPQRKEEQNLVNADREVIGEEFWRILHGRRSEVPCNFPKSDKSSISSRPINLQ